jgi:hypothetical protein
VVSHSCINKLSLVAMQLPEKHKENFDVSSEGPSSGVTAKIVVEIAVSWCILVNRCSFLKMFACLSREVKCACLWM